MPQDPVTTDVRRHVLQEASGSLETTTRPRVRACMVLVVGRDHDNLAAVCSEEEEFSRCVGELAWCS